MPLSRPLPRGPNALLSSAVSQDPGRASHTQGSPRRRGPACCSHSLPPPPCPLAPPPTDPFANVMWRL